MEGYGTVRNAKGRIDLPWNEQSFTERHERREHLACRRGRTGDAGGRDCPVRPTFGYAFCRWAHHASRRRGPPCPTRAPDDPDRPTLRPGVYDRGPRSAHAERFFARLGSNQYLSRYSERLIAAAGVFLCAAPAIILPCGLLATDPMQQRLRSKKRTGALRLSCKMVIEPLDRRGSGQSEQN